MAQMKIKLACATGMAVVAAVLPTFEPSVALFIDGVYMPRSGLGVDDLVDISRIEVLKGPQSTLYGKNATAGVVSVFSARSASTFSGSAEVSLSNIEGGRNAFAKRFAGSLTGPLSNQVRVRLTADLSGATLTAITGWSKYKSELLATDIDQVALPLITFRDTQAGESFSQEVRLVSASGGTFERLVGGYYPDPQFERGDLGNT